MSDRTRRCSEGVPDLCPAKVFQAWVVTVVEEDAVVSRLDSATRNVLFIVVAIAWRGVSVY